MWPPDSCDRSVCIHPLLKPMSLLKPKASTGMSREGLAKLWMPVTRKQSAVPCVPFPFPLVQITQGVPVYYCSKGTVNAFDVRCALVRAALVHGGSRALSKSCLTVGMPLRLLL